MKLKINFSFAFLILLLGFSRKAQAQQIVFNLPSADVLDTGKVYGEVDLTFKPDKNPENVLQRFSSFVPRIVIGTGGRVEAGKNFKSYPCKKVFTKARLGDLSQRLTRLRRVLGSSFYRLVRVAPPEKRGAIGSPVYKGYFINGVQIMTWTEIKNAVEKAGIKENDKVTIIQCEPHHGAKTFHLIKLGKVIKLTEGLAESACGEASGCACSFLYKERFLCST